MAARILRRCVQENASKDALKREETFAKVNKWKDGKIVVKGIYIFFFKQTLI